MLTNKTYNTGVIPKQMKESVFIPLPKKDGLLESDNYRLINFMSHITKIFLRIIMRRVRSKLLLEISEGRFDFKKDYGTRDAMFMFRIPGERSIEMQLDIHIALIDYEKAFDRVKHGMLMKDMKTLGKDEKDLRLQNNLYKEQLAAISISGKHSNWAQIKRGVRQRCVLSLDPFSLYAEKITSKIVSTENIKINGSPISNIRYANDAVLIDLHHLLSSLQSGSEKRDLTINKKKTKIMVLGKRAKILAATSSSKS